MSTPHNSASIGQIAKTVLMPGDPLRSRFIARTFLDEPGLVNGLRAINGYTGYYHGKPVTVMASGMGMPSIGIYSYELFKHYDVDNIIRVGSAGSYVPELKIFDVVLASAAYSETTYAKVQCGYDKDITYPSAALNGKLIKAASDLGIKLHEGIIHSSDVFYHESADYQKAVIEDKHCVAVEMESFALFSNARVTGKNAACILTISDSFVSKEETTAEQREKNFLDMMRIALNAAIAED